MIYPHGAIEERAPNLWQVEGSLPFPLKRNMAIHRLGDGRLVLYSVIALADEELRKIEALGTPAFMVIPSPGHTMDARFYKERYPALKIAYQGPPLAGITVDGEPEAVLGGTGLEVLRSAGMKTAETHLLVPGNGGKALLCCDVLGLNPPRKPGLGGYLFSLMGVPGDRFGVPRIVRARQITSKKDLRAWLTALADRGDIAQVLGSHGPPLMTGATPALRDAAVHL